MACRAGHARWRLLLSRVPRSSCSRRGGDRRATDHDAAATAWAAGSGCRHPARPFYRAGDRDDEHRAPLSATGAAVPVIVGLVSGERRRRCRSWGSRSRSPASCSRPRTDDADADARRTNRTALLLALVAAVGFGCFFVGMDGRGAGRRRLVLLAARAPRRPHAGACAVRRPPLPTSPAALGTIAAIGLFDLLANLLFVLATGGAAQRGRGARCPVPAVTGGWRGRSARAAHAGSGRRVLVTLAGVVALAAGG